MSSINTKNSSSVASAVRSLFAGMFPQAKPAWLDVLFKDVDDAYHGRNPDYLPCDLGYHDLEHSLQASLCYAQVMEGRHRAGVRPIITAQQFELGLAAVLLHDIGYLKLRGDKSGTGAKYNYIHVLRSCSFAAAYLPRLGIGLPQVQGVLAAINCTGPTSEIARMQFRDQAERMIGCAVATADYLAQMAAPDYPDELEILYREFEESCDFAHVPAEERAFKSARDLMEKTPAFWEKVVLPKLDSDFRSLHRFLAEPYPDGTNPYLEAIEQNIAEVKRRLRAAKKK